VKRQQSAHGHSAFGQGNSYDCAANGNMSRNFNDGPENFAERMRSLQRNITFEDSQRNARVFYDQMFDLRCNGTVKRIGLLLWAVPLLCLGLSSAVSALSSGSALGLILGVILGVPSLGASVVAIWTAFFLRPPRRRRYHA
jgi:hypothetical protein